MTNSRGCIDAIYRYPVKGLSPQKLERIALAPSQTLPADRLYAIENGPSGFDPADPQYFPKQRFLMLMRNERLANLQTGYDEASHTLTIQSEGREAVRAYFRTKEGRLAIEARSSAASCRMNCADRQKCCAAITTASRTSPRKLSRSSIWDRSRRGSGDGGGRSSRSATVSWQYLCRRLAGLA